MKLGMASVAFRQLTAEQMISFATDIHMDIIEWNFCHVPTGEEKRANEISRLCQQEGLEVSAYHSDACVSSNATKQASFEAVLATAQSLGTNCLRIRAGEISSEKAEEDALRYFTEHAEQLAQEAEECGMEICFPFCENSLFDNYNVVIALLERMNAKNVFVDWRPNRTTSMIYNIYELKMMLRYIKNVHVFYQNTLGESLPLVEGRDGWQQYIKILRSKPERALLLESVQNDSPEEMKRDFELLKELTQL